MAENNKLPLEGIRKLSIGILLILLGGFLIGFSLFIILSLNWTNTTPENPVWTCIVAQIAFGHTLILTGVAVAVTGNLIDRALNGKKKE
jgi:hypothetical protein